MAEFNNFNDIALKAERFLFAEDLVSYISLKFYGIAYTDTKMKGQEFLVNHFNDTVKQAVDFIKWQNEKVNPLSFEIIGSLCKSDKQYYKTFVKEVLNHYSEDELEAGTFLYISVYFVDLALRCYPNSGTEILELAVYSVLDTFAIFTHGWLMIYSVAEDIITLLKDGNLCPDYTPADVRAKNLDSEKSVFKNLEYVDEMESAQNNFMKQDSWSVRDEEKIKNSSEREDCLTAITKQSSVEKVKHICRHDAEYFEDLALEVELLVSFEASLFSSVFLGLDTRVDFGLDFDNLQNSENESSSSPDIQSQETEERNITENVESNRIAEDVHLEQSDGKCIAKHLQISKNESFISNESSSLADGQSQETEKKIIAENVAANQIIEDAHVEQHNGKSIEKNNSAENSEEIIMTVKNDKTLTDPLFSYKPEWNIDGYDFVVLLKADSVLFAEDLVRYISKEFYSIPYQVSRVEGNRSLVYSAFNETVKQAVTFIHRESETMNRYHYEVIKNFSKSNKHNYRKFIPRVLAHYSYGLNAGMFLYLCVYFIEIALKCYSSSFPEILDFAVYSVLDAFCILTDKWLDLNNIAEKIVKFSRNITLYRDCEPSIENESLILNKVLECADSIAWNFKAVPSNELSNSNKIEVDKSSSDNKRYEEIPNIFSLIDIKAMETSIQTVQSKNEKNIASSNSNGKSDLFPATKCSEKSDLSNELNDSEIKFLNDLAMEARLIVTFEAAMTSAVFLSCQKAETPRLLSKMAEEEKEKLFFFDVELKDLLANQKCEIIETGYTKLQSANVCEQEKIDEMDSSSSSMPVAQTNQVLLSSCDPNKETNDIMEETTEDSSKTEDRSSLALLSDKPELFSFVYVPTSLLKEEKDE